MNADDFLLEEYKSRSQELFELMSEARKLELYSAGAVAAIYSWFVAVSVENRLAWFLPLLVPMLGLIRSWAFYERVRQISEYVQKIELHFLADEKHLAGWESEYAKIRVHGLTPSGILFWVILTLACFIIPYLIRVAG